MRFWIPGALILATLIHLVQRAYQARRLAYGSTNLERVTAPVPKQRIGGRGCHGTEVETIRDFAPHAILISLQQPVVPLGWGSAVLRCGDPSHQMVWSTKQQATTNQSPRRQSQWLIRTVGEPWHHHPPTVKPCHQPLCSKW